VAVKPILLVLVGPTGVAVADPDPDPEFEPEPLPGPDPLPAVDKVPFREIDGNPDALARVVRVGTTPGPPAVVVAPGQYVVVNVSVVVTPAVVYTDVPVEVTVIWVSVTLAGGAGTNVAVAGQRVVVTKIVEVIFPIRAGQYVTVAAQEVMV
jgi:hypothetical protein